MEFRCEIHAQVIHSTALIIFLRTHSSVIPQYLIYHDYIDLHRLNIVKAFDE